ncbi:MAG: hypothetical protein LZ168_03930 [Thaumarchaeota archaeon]|jgi:hypothetical protein|nr:hypothetical protein [Candidatus Geocrenenecus arthurdayi]
MKFLGFLLLSIISLSSTPIAYALSIIGIDSYDGGDRVIWSITSNPSNSWDIAYAICEKNEYIYVIGVDQYHGYHAGYEIHVERRFKKNGELIKVWTHNLSISDIAYDCIIAGDYLYIVGSSNIEGDRSWLILAVDLGLKSVTYVLSNPSDKPDEAMAVSAYGDYLYVGGVDTLGGDCRWRIEKRSLADLSLIDEHISNPTDLCDVIFDVKVNPVTGDVWVIGYEALRCRKCAARLEILNSDLELVKVLRPFTGCFKQNLAFDFEGNAYISGVNVLKFSRVGDTLLNSNVPARHGVLWVDGNLYSFDIDVIEGSWMPAIYVLDQNLQLRDQWKINLRLNSSLYATSCFSTAFPVFGEPSSDGRNIYLIGNIGDPSAGDIHWIIYTIGIDVRRLTALKTTLLSLFAALSLSLIILSLEYFRLKKSSTLLYIRRKT